MNRIDSYNREATRPLVGTLWVWEPETAPALIKVSAVRWNGEEWWVEAEIVAVAPRPGCGEPGERYPNDLSRFWEAVHRVSRRAGAAGTPGVTRRGAPQADERAPSG